MMKIDIEKTAFNARAKASMRTFLRLEDLGGEGGVDCSDE